MNFKSVADIQGPWTDPGFESSLLDRCKQHWSIPVNELPDVMVATYLDQKIATSLMISEARRRIESGKLDDTEFFDGQLREALEKAVDAPSA